jgi:L-seryl-tRNA(Ser) seleniumtransferase/D-glucosaminate-6-phosphate ammonia-lyase
MKVSKEAIIGLITALERLSEDNMAKLLDQRRIWLELIASKIRGIQGVEVEITETWPGGHPLLRVKIDESKLGSSAFEVVQRLKKGKPPIYVTELFLNQRLFIIHSINLNEEHTGIVSERLYTAITS